MQESADGIDDMTVFADNPADVGVVYFEGKCSITAGYLEFVGMGKKRSNQKAQEVFHTLV
ncbi:hypothetical protein A3E17_05435 [Candidatus Amesbacteria bacterium RIFCSPHIGHO2_12_FULL_48_14]|uniref:Uncharacterized protein n=1 Tax=Candidatus Amesbacteria bacterium RIFCSPHIGHO2_12_FULL_48_14 TaxID=1797257 RepID=A0A1F4Z7W7_9BACT|nr:MAG: hypothetical protein A2702_01310 [Candidatus Amesbacteria bacterium RIFCSPHIGHO2_01_FULL_48_75]OGD01504.1 MAG: hypothetical protein A3E17_05435 [Candidatus Amesbacteria bacterium RIFCSPHIGHO2_12_FULL_48_14]